MIERINSKSGKGKILLVLVIIILLVIGIPAYFLYSKVSNMEFAKLDETDLAINANLSQDVGQSMINSVKNIVLFGVDTRDNDGEFSGRSDTIMIASINTKTKSIKLISIPRDTYVNVPGYGKTKINHAYSYGKEQLSIKTINQNFDLAITDFATIDFAGLMNIINEVGGIKLEITDTEMKYINENSGYAYSITKNNVKKVKESGLVTLSGEQALTHSRNRTVGNDFTRAGRQRDILYSLFDEISKKNVTEIATLSDSILKEVKTNINVAEYLGIVPSVVFNKNEYIKNIESVQIPSTDYAKGQMIKGIYYFVPDVDKTKSDFIKYLYNK